MNPETDKFRDVPLGDGRSVRVVQPGANVRTSRNWRLKPEAFERYREHIKLALDRWPQETSFEVPNGMSPNTFEHRLRDAVQALIVFQYDPELYTRMVAVRAEIVVSQSQDGKSVWFRAKQSAGKPVSLTLGHTISRPQQTTVAVKPQPSADELSALCLLLSSGQLEGPYQCRGRFAEQLIVELEEKYNVAFAYDEQSDTTTVL